MKKAVIILTFLLAALTFNLGYAQNSTPAKADVKSESGPVYTKVEIMPSFPGGEEKLLQFLKDNIQYPKEAKDNNKEGTVHVSFVVDETGKVTDVKMQTRMAYGMDHEAMRVIRMMPNWIPGKQDGKPVAVQMVLPIKFSMGASQEVK